MRLYKVATGKNNLMPSIGGKDKVSRVQTYNGIVLSLKKEEIWPYATVLMNLEDTVNSGIS